MMSWVMRRKRIAENGENLNRKHSFLFYQPPRSGKVIQSEKLLFLFNNQLRGLSLRKGTSEFRCKVWD